MSCTGGDLSLPQTSIVVVGAHALDAEAMAGATAAAAIRKGHRVTFIHLTRGERGDPSKDPEAYGRQLEREMEEAAATIGAECFWPGYLAGRLPDQETLASELAEVFRRCRAEIVITHWRGSWHPRHVQAHWAVVQAVRLMSEMGGTRLPIVLFGENCEDLDGFVPQLYVDVTESVETAWEAMGKYEMFRKSRCLGPSGRTVHISYWEYYRTMASIRGIEAGVRYAQSFKLARLLLSSSTDLARTASIGTVGLGVKRVF